MKNKFRTKPYESKLILEELEARRLFSGGIEGLVATHIEDPLATYINVDTNYEPATASQVQIANESINASPAETITRREIAFVDTNVEGYQQLIDDLSNQNDAQRQIEVVLLTADRDGLEQISETLQNRQGIDAIHIFSYGRDGAVELGGVWHNSLSIDAQASQIAQWGAAFTAEADILLYGCNVAGNAEGEAFVGRLSQLSGADVSASEDITGNANLGGDWDLEYRDGNIETSIALSQATQQSWSGVLDITTGLLGHWKFDANATDASGNSYNGTLTNGALIDTTAGTNKAGAGKLSLDGVNAYVGLSAHSANFAGFTQGTVAGWIKTTGINQTIFSISDTADIGSYASLYLGSSGYLTYEVKENGVMQLAVYRNSATINDGNWHHVAVTIGTTGNNLYVDGVLATSGQLIYDTGNSATQKFFSNVSSLDAMAIGRNQDSNGGKWYTAGNVDDVRVYNRALTASDIALLANDAPTLNSTKSPALTAINEDAGVPVGAVGTLVSQLVDFASPSGQVDNVTDIDSGALLGIAVTATDTTNGTWWYSTNNGTNWNTLGAASNANARLLAADANTRLYFQPNANYNGTLASAITFRAWDQTSGTNGATADASVNGGITAFSAATDTASLVVNSVVETPINTVPGTQSTNEDTALVFSSGNGNQIAITDADAGSNPIEVTVTVTNGTLTLSGISGLTFTTGDGSADSTMTFRGTVANINSALNGLSYIPTSNYSGGSTLTISSRDNTLVALDIDTNLQARYTFDGNANDVASGTAQNGTLIGNAGFVNDPVRGQVLNLDGTGDYVNVADYNSFWGLTQGTVAANVKFSGTDYSAIFSINDGVFNNYLNVFVSNGKVGFQTKDNGVWIFETISTATINDGNWHHIAITVNGSGNQLYIDGAVATRTFTQGNASTSSFFGALNNVTTVSIGTNQGNGYFLGQIDDVRVYGRALSVSEVSTLASDLSLTDTDTVAVTVAPVADAPVNTIPGTQSTNEDVSLVFSSANGNPIVITDVDAGANPIAVTVSVTNGTLSLSGVSGLTFTAGDGTTDSTMTFRGTVANINTALNGLAYIPANNYNGSSTLTISSRDNTLVALDIDTNLQARYTFDGNANDVASGTAQNGTLVGNATYVNDALRGQVLSLDGADDYVDLISHTATFGTYSQGTFAAWIKTTATGYSTIFDIGDGAAGRNYVSFYVDNGQLNLEVVDETVIELNTYSTASVNDGNWHHVAVTVNASGNQLYIDGVAASRTFVNGSATTNSFISSLNSKTATLIGAYNNGAINGEFLGLMDDFRIYNRAITAAEVATLAADLSLTDTDAVAVTVVPVNDAPVNTLPANRYTSLNTAVTFSGAGGNAIQIADVDAASNPVRVTLSVSNGTLTLASTTGLTLVGGANGSATLTYSGTVSALNTALNNGVTFNPTSNYRGLAQLTITTDDQGNTGGSAQSDIDTVNVHVGAIVVTNLNDTANGDTSSIAKLVASDGGDGISLREAILAANATPNVGGPDYIYFNITGAGPHVINLGSALPSISSPVIIDASTEPDYSGTPVVVLNGGGTIQDGIRLYSGSGGSTIRGLVIQNFTEDGIDISGSDSNTIAGNWIGLNSTGTAAAGNVIGVNIWNSNNNVIGGGTVVDRNIISGNTSSGVEVNADNGSSTGNRISGNYIGTNALGTTAVGNENGGIYINTAGNIIGGTTAGYGNVISGTTNWVGVQLATDASNTLIAGNLIGLNAAGTAALGNVNGGIHIASGNNIIGGTTSAARNVIHGGGSPGIMFRGLSATGNVVIGNYIGTDISGTVDINGTSKSSSASGIIMESGASGNRIGTNADGSNDAEERNIISGNNWYGIEMVGSGTSNNLVQGNYIGTDATGLVALGNSEGGVSFWNGASGNQVGSGLSGAGNVISGNNIGVFIANQVNNNKVQGNLIGLGADGSTAIGNSTTGIYVNNGGNTGANVTGNIIGTDADGNNDAGERNVISANLDGIILTDTQVTGNTIAGNYIGTDVTGSFVRGNTFQGIALWNGANNNTIGGTTAVSGNLISGNGNNGIAITDAGTSGNVVQGNRIGVNATGTARLGNGTQGIWINGGASGNIVGGTTAGAANVIGANTYAGVDISGPSTTGNTVAGNFIGTDATGTLNLSNETGVHIHNGASGNIIGGAASGSGNIIAFNTSSGVLVIDATSSGNAILRNSIHDNGDLGIDLGNDGVSGNDTGDGDTGANNLQNFPVITSAVTNGVQLVLTGYLNSKPNTHYRIEFYRSASGDGSGHGEGQTYMDHAEVLTDDSGSVNFTATLGLNVVAGAVITATATETNATYSSFTDTSEFALNLIAEAPNAAPAGTDGSISVTEDTVYTFSVSDFGFADSDGDSLSRVYITTLPGAGTLTLNSVAVTVGQSISVANINDGDLKFTPVANANGADYASFTFQVQDDGGTANGGVDFDASANTITFNVTAVNDAPVASGTAELPAVLEDTASPSGSTVASLFASNFSDPDITNASQNQLAGVVVRSQSVNSAQGRWQYSIDGGNNWINFGALSDSNALTLRTTDLIRFSPTVDYNGTPTNIAVRLIDNSVTVSGGATVNVSTNGTTTAYSANTVTLGTSVTAVNDSPVIATTGTVLSYTENDSPTILDGALTVTDADSTNLVSATVSVTSGFVSGQDVLAFTNQNGITGSWNAGTGILTLSGTATVANYQTALRSITYVNTSDNPSTTARTVSFVVNDGSVNSNTGTRNISVATVNDAPTSTGGLVIGIEDTAKIFSWSEFNVSDVDTAIGATTAVRVLTLPADGILQYHNGSTWLAISVNQVLTKSTLDAGLVRFVPDTNETGYDGYGAPGVGNDFQTYAQFNFASVQTTAITIVNPGAESQALANGAWSNPTTGWTSSGADAGAQNTVSSQFPNDNDSSLYANAGATLSQTLGTTFNSSNNYSLSFEVGWRNDAGYPTAPGFRVELWAGGTRVGYVDQTAVTMVKGSFVSGTLAVDGTSFSALNGQALEIRLVGVSSQSNFDNMSLTSFARATDLGATATMSVDITPVNDSPVINSASLTISEGQTVTLTTANFNITDPDNSSFTYTVSSVSGGYFQLTTNAGVVITSFTSAELSANQVQFVDDGNETAPTFSVTVNDGTVDSNTLAATVNYTPANDAPVLSSAGLTVTEGATVTLSGANFSVTDPDNNSFTYTVSSVVGGSFQLSTNPGVAITSFTSAELSANQVQFVDDGNETAPTFSVTVNDGTVDSNTLAATVNYTPANDAPVLSSAGLTVTEGATVTLSGADFSVTDPDNSSFTYTVSSVVGGSFQLSTNPGVVITSFTTAQLSANQVQFVDDGNETAPSFSVTVNDGTVDSNTLAATVNYTPANDAPVLGSAGLTVTEGATVTLSGANFGVTDPDNNSFTYTVSSVVGGSFQLSTNPGVVITSFTTAQLSANQVQFVDDGNETAPSFSVTVNDGAVNSNTVAASVTYSPVNDAPVITAANLTVNEGQTVTVSAANFGVTDPDNSSFTYTVSSVVGGSFQLSTNPGVAVTSFTTAQLSANQVQFVDDGNETAPSFSVTVNDGAVNSNSVAASVTYSPVNDAPVITAANLTVNEGQTVTVTAANFSVTDPDNNSFTYTVSSVVGGSFQLSTNPGVVITSFTTAQLSANQVQFVDDGNETAPTFSVTVNDGTVDSNTLAATVNYTPANDAPVLSSAGLTVTEGATVTLSGADFGVTDPDNSSFTYTVSSVVGGSFQLSTNPGVVITSFTTAQLSANQVQFVDDGNETAPSFSVTVNDGAVNSNTVAASVTYSPVNDAPVITAANLTVNEGQTVTVSAANFGVTDSDNSSFTYTVSSVSGGYFQLTTNPGVVITSFTTAQLSANQVQFIDDGNETAPTFSVTVNDGTGDSNTLAATVNYTAANDAPVLSSAGLTVTEGATVTLSGADFGVTDPDNNSFTYTVSSVVGGSFQLSTNPGVVITSFTTAQLSANQVQFVDDGNETAPSFSVTVNDGAVNSNTVAASVTYSPVNDAPVITAANLTVNEGQTVTVSAANFGVTDPDNSSFTYTVSSVVGGSFQLSTNPGVAVTSFTTAQLSANQVQFVDDGNETAPSFSVTVNDGAVNSNSVAASVTYSPVNDAPVITAANLTVNEGQTVTVTAANFSVTDPDNNSFTYTVSSVVGGSFQLSTNPGVVITSFTTAQLSANQVQFVDDGNETAPTFSVTVNDGTVDSNTLAATVNYTPANDAPVLSSAGLTVTEGATVTLSGADFGVTDPDNSSFTYTVSSVVGGSFQLSTNPGVAVTSFTTAQLSANQVQFVDDGNETAPTFSVTVNDGTGDSNTLAATVNYTAANDAPVLSSAGLTVTEGATVTLSGANFGVTDPDNSSFTYTVSSVVGGSFQLSTNPGVVITSFTTAQLSANQVQFIDDGNETAPTFSVTVNDGTVDSNTLAATVNYTPANDAPVLSSAGLTVTEGATVTLSGADFSVTDPDNSSFTYTVSSVVGGSFQLSTNPGVVITSFTTAQLSANQVQFVDDGNETAPTFTVTVNDGTVDSNTLAATVNYTPANDTPVLSSAGLTVTEGATVTLSGADFGVTDPDNNSFTYTVSSVVGGSFQLSTNPGVVITSFTTAQLSANQVQFVDDGNETAPSFSVTVNDGAVNSNTVAASVTYSPVNDAPVITAANLTVNEGQTVTVSAANFGVTDPDNSSFTYTVSSVVGGSFQLSTNPGVAVTSFTTAQLSANQVQFIDDGNETAPTFSVTVNDGTVDSNTLAATVNYTPANDAPVLSSAGLTVTEGATVTLSGANFGVTDPDNSSFTYTVSSVVGGRFQLSTNPGVVITSFTTAQLNADQVQFVDDGNETAPTFSVTVNDGTVDSNTLAATVNYTPANDAPVLSSAGLTVTEGATVTLSGANFGVTDPDNSSFTYTVSSVVGGSFQLSTNPGVAVTSFTTAQLSANQVQFVDDGNETAPSFSVTVNDGAVNSNTVAASVTYSPVNDAPVITAANLTVNEGQTVTVSAANFGVTDSDNSSFTYTVSSVSGGYFQLTTNPGVVITSFTTAQLSANQVQFIDDGNETAPTFSVTVNDGTGDSNTLAATVNYTAANDAPVLSSAGLTVTEGATVTLSGANFGVTDPDNSSFTYTVSSVVGGSFQLSTNPGVVITSFTTAQLSANQVQFVDDGNETAPSFSVTVNDGAVNSNTVAASVTYSPVNDAPVITAAHLTVNEGQTVTVSAANFGVTDPDNSSFTYTVSAINGGFFQLSSATGNVITTFTSAQLAANQVQFVDDDNETAPSFSVTVNDSAVDSNTVAASVTYNPANDAPVITAANLTVSEGQTVTVSAANFGVTDPDNSSFTYTVSSVVGGSFQLSTNPGVVITSFTTAQLSANQVQFVDDGNESAPSFSVTVNDGPVNSNTMTAFINYTSINDAPTVANAIIDPSATEDSVFSFQVPVNVFSDVDTGDTLIYSAILSSGGSLPAWLNFNTATRTFSGTPTNADVGSIVIRVIATDGNSASVFDDFTLTIAHQNHAPTIDDGATVILSPSMDKENQSNGTSIASILSRSNWADADSSDLNGIAVTSMLGNGAWQYSSDGLTWNEFGLLSPAHALLLSSTSYVRYSADFIISETAFFSYKAWDQFTGTASTNDMPSYASTTDNIVNSSFSTDTAIASLAVEAQKFVNPIISNSPNSLFNPIADYNKSIANSHFDAKASTYFYPDSIQGSSESTYIQNGVITDLESYIDTLIRELDTSARFQLSVEQGDISDPTAIKRRQINKSIADLTMNDGDNQSRKVRTHNGIYSNVNVPQSKNIALKIDNSLMSEATESEFLDRIDQIRNHLDREDSTEYLNRVEVQIMLGTTVSLTAGFVSWVLRGGSLLASFLSTVPLFNRFDPVPVLISAKKNKNSMMNKTNIPDDFATNEDDLSDTHSVNDLEKI